MNFSLDHWRDPRGSIAVRYKNDDFAYATHGALVAMECVRRLDIRAQVAKHQRLLDYGSGTGRIGRVLAGYFGSVTCYDPSEECVAMAHEEARVPQVNVGYTSKLDEVIPPFDVAVSVNVIEHLSLQEQQDMLNIIRRMLKPDGALLLWYNVRNNQTILRQFFRGDWWQEDEAAFSADEKASINVRLFKF